MNKRVLLLCGHYGSGKTNIAVNLAQALKREYPTVTLADLDIVNPYFRSKDSAQDLEAAGIRLICSRYANSNVDIPALPPDLYALTDDRRMRAIIDVGGDDRGALALGRLAPSILEEGNFEMLMVVNFYRPLTRDSQSMLEVMKEMEFAAGMPFTGIVNNSNLGDETTAVDVLSTVEKALDFSKLCGLPLKFTTVREELYETLRGKIENLYPLKLQKKYY